MCIATGPAILQQISKQRKAWVSSSCATTHLCNPQRLADALIRELLQMHFLKVSCPSWVDSRQCICKSVVFIQDDGLSFTPANKGVSYVNEDCVRCPRNDRSKQQHTGTAVRPTALC